MNAQISCPACGREQAKSAECRGCGIVFARYGEARSLFTARRTPTRGPRTPSLTLQEVLRPGWWMVLAALVLGLLIGRWTAPSQDAPAPRTRVIEAAPDPVAEAPSAPITNPGLSADQLRYGLDLDEWRAAGSPEPPPTPKPTPIAATADAPPEPTPAVASPRGPPGESRAPTASKTSPNDRFDPVGSRGWYSGYGGYERALDERDRRDRTMVVYFHAPWCAWCARFRSEYLSHPDVRGFLDDTIRVHLDPEHSDEEAELATLFGVRAFPSFFVVPVGTERPERLHPFLGDVELDPEAFARLCERVSRGGTFPEPRVLGSQGVVPFGFGG